MSVRTIKGNLSELTGIDAADLGLDIGDQELFDDWVGADFGLEEEVELTLRISNSNTAMAEFWKGEGGVDTKMRSPSVAQGRPSSRAPPPGAPPVPVMPEAFGGPSGQRVEFEQQQQQQSAGAPGGAGGEVTQRGGIMSAAINVAGDGGGEESAGRTHTVSTGRYQQSELLLMVDLRDFHPTAGGPRDGPVEIKVAVGDDPHEVAQRFCGEHGVAVAQVATIAQRIHECLTMIYTKEVELNNAGAAGAAGAAGVAGAAPVGFDADIAAAAAALAQPPAQPPVQPAAQPPAAAAARHASVDSEEEDVKTYQDGDEVFQQGATRGGDQGAALP